MQGRYMEWLKFLAQTQPRRVEHCANVAETAVRLAEKLGENTVAAYEAGLLHDCAKGLPLDEQALLMARWKNGLNVEGFPKLWHAPASAVLARERFGVSESVAWAIARHAPAQPDMTLFQKIIYVADKIEPSRTYVNINKLRNQVSRHFEQGFRLVMSDELCSMMRQFHPVHPAVIQGWNAYIGALPSKPVEKDRKA